MVGAAAALTTSTAVLPLDVLGQTVLRPEVLSETEVSVDWEVLCSKARRGEAIRLLFVTSVPHDAPTGDTAGCGRTAQWPAGHPATRPHRAEFRLLGSTDATAAQYTAPNQGPSRREIRNDPRSGGTKANDDADSYDEAWARSVPEDELGSPRHRSVLRGVPSCSGDDGVRSGPPARTSLACGELFEKCRLEGRALFGPAGPPGTGPGDEAVQQPWPGGKGLATLSVARSGSRCSKPHTTTIPPPARVQRSSRDEVGVEALEHALASIDATRGRCADESGSRS